MHRISKFDFIPRQTTPRQTSTRYLMLYVLHMVELVLAAVPESGPRDSVRTSISRNTHTKMVHLQPHCSTLVFTSVEVENVEWPDMHGWSILSSLSLSRTRQHSSGLLCYLQNEWIMQRASCRTAGPAKKKAGGGGKTS